MMQRIPEPELMDSEAQVRAYSEADFEEPHQVFADGLLAWLQDSGERGSAIDLGCGPADITSRVAIGLPEWTFDAVDGGPTMLRWAAENLARKGLSERVRLSEHRLPDPTMAKSQYDLVFSNSLLHHLKRPEVLWETVMHVGRQGAAVYIMDLRRPSTTQKALSLVDAYSKDEPEILRTDFYNSLCAAYTVSEVRSQLEQAGLSGLKVKEPTDRHILVCGRLP